MSVHKRIKVLGLGVVATLALAGCGLQPSGSYVPEIGQGSIEPVEGAEGQPLVVASKNYTEQLILGKIAALTSSAAGFEVTDLSNIPGSQPTRQVMVSHEADMFFEYTGSAWLTYLGHEQGIKDQQGQWEAVRDADAEYGLTWGPPAPMNNTYAFAARQEVIDEYGLKTFSDIAKVPVQERTFCVEAEFNSRQDGINPMLETYGIPRGTPDGVPEDNVAILDAGTIYSATAQGDTCNFGEVFTTDGRIPALNLTVLDDDKLFFPHYNVAPVLNTEMDEQYPELMDRYEQVSQKLDNETLQQLNYRVDVEGEEPAQVAFDWMVSEGFITDPGGNVQEE